MTNISVYKLDAASVQLKNFDHLAKPDDFMEVSLWYNGEGFDVYISGKDDQFISVSWGEFKALKKLLKELGK